MKPDEFRKFGKEMIDWIADYHEKGFPGTVWPVHQIPGDVMQKLPRFPPEDQEGADALFTDFKDLIVPGLTHWNDPRFQAYFPCNNSLPSILGELLAAGVGVNCFSWSTSPSATELEIRMMEWLGELIGLPWRGALQDTASSSTLLALLSAREEALGKERAHGLSAIPNERRFVCYVSDQGHSSIQKAVRIAGIGEENLRIVPSDTLQSMDPQSFRRLLVEDKRDGLRPLFVTFSLGTTSTTAVDNISELLPIAKEFGLWCHVDAALAGSVAILPEYSWLMNGVRDCDSFVFNPHKWLFTNFDCSAYFCKDPELLKSAMSIEPEYLRTQSNHANKVENLRDWGLTLGRSFRALKLWFVLRSYGKSGLQNELRKHIAFAKRFANWIEAQPKLSLFREPSMSLVCFGVKETSNASANEKTKALLQSINDTGESYLSHTIVEGKYLIRVSFGQTRSQEADVTRLEDLILKQLV